jgi:hypothetical protein
MGNNPSESRVWTETPFLMIALRPNTMTSLIASLRSKRSFRGGVFTGASLREQRHPKSKYEVIMTAKPRIESRHRSGYAADCDIIICGGNAKPTDQHLAVRTGDIGRLLEMKEAAN